MAPKSHILLFGATGAVGSLFAQRALSADHLVTLYVRSPQKLSKELSSHPNATVVIGQLTDKEKLTEAINYGATSCVLLVGGNPWDSGTAVLDGLKVIYPLLVEKEVKRVICLATPCYVAPQDQSSFITSAIILLVSIFASSAYKQVVGIGQLTAESSTEQMEWTVVRLPSLLNGDSGAVNAGYTGDGKTGYFLHRKSLADWCLRELEVGEWVGKAPALSNV